MSARATSNTGMPAGYFGAMYAKDDDPWGFSSRWYEYRKYALTMALLSSPRYESAFEPGCSIGILSAALAERCDELICTDLSSRAIELASENLAPYGERVRAYVADVVDDWPAGRFDLIVLSELLYYLDDASLTTVVDRLPDSLTADGELVAVHWRWPVGEYPRTGDDVHEVLMASDLVHRGGYADRDFRADVFTARPLPSVAESGGLVGPPEDGHEQ